MGLTHDPPPPFGTSRLPFRVALVCDFKLMGKLRNEKGKIENSSQQSLKPHYRAGCSRSNFQNLDIVPVFDITSLQRFYCSIFQKSKIPHAGWITRFLLISSAFIAIIRHNHHILRFIVTTALHWHYFSILQRHMRERFLTHSLVGRWCEISRTATEVFEYYSNT